MSWFRNILTRFKLTDYGTTGQPMPTANSEGMTRVLAGEAPVTRDMFSGGLASWPDDVYDLDQEGYDTIRRCSPLLIAVDKMAAALSKLDWQVRGGNPTRAAEIREGWEQTIGWPKYFQRMTWARVEGYHVMQIVKAKEQRGEWITNDWSNCGARKWKAGSLNGKGTVHWDGTRLAKVAEIASGVPAFVTKDGGKTTDINQAMLLPRDEFVIFRPGGGSNPEGETEYGLIAYDIAKDWKAGRMNASKYVDIYGIPMRGYEKAIDKMRPGAISGSLEAVQAKNAGLVSGASFTMPSGDSLKLFQPTGNALGDLWAHMNQLAGLVWQLFFGQKLTQDTQDSGQTGSSTIALSEKDTAVLAFAMEHAEALNADWLPWYVGENDAKLTKLAEGESECYLWPEPPKMSDAGNMEGEDTDNPDADPSEPSNANPRPGAIQADDTEAMAALFATMQDNALRRTGARGGLTRLAAFSPTPPVHPN